MAQIAFNAYVVRDYEKDGQKKGFWTKIGAAFANSDGEGYTLTLDAFPVNGRIILRKPDAKDEGEQPG